jgi:hypothetical protein
MAESDIFKIINTDKSKFDHSMARELMKFMTDKESEQKVVLEIKLLYEFYQSHKDDADFPLNTFSDAYGFIQFLPFIKNQVPMIEDHRPKHIIDTSDDNWKLFKKLYDEELIMSERLERLSKEIQSLECNKRQPLELFTLKDEYKVLRKKESENLKEQKFVLSKIISARISKE